MRQARFDQLYSDSDADEEDGAEAYKNAQLELSEHCRILSCIDH
jgi:hypothetical protein